jgi:short-subunit dehydrogenase
MSKPIVLITGASSGIGAEFAKTYAKKGHDIIITGRREAKLNIVAEECRTLGASVEIIIADLTSMEQTNLVAEKTINRGVSVLINNAGFGHTNTFVNDTIGSQLEMLDVHVRAMLVLTHAALPSMIKQKHGTIINVSSLAGFITLPGAALYGSTKACINTFSETIAVVHKKDGIRVQALCPGFTHTDFHEKINIPREKQKNRGLIRWMNPAQVVQCSLRSLEKGKVICIPGLTNNIIYHLVTKMPRSLYYKIVGVMNAKDMK